MCPTKIQGFSLSKKGEPVLGDSKQVLLQALGEGDRKLTMPVAGPSSQPPDGRAWARRWAEGELGA